MNVLLAANFDSIHTLAMNGKVVRTEFPERDIAVLTRSKFRSSRRIRRFLKFD